MTQVLVSEHLDCNEGVAEYEEEGADDAQELVDLDGERGIRALEIEKHAVGVKMAEMRASFVIIYSFCCCYCCR